MLDLTAYGLSDLLIIVPMAIVAIGLGVLRSRHRARHLAIETEKLALRREQLAEERGRLGSRRTPHDV